MVTIRPADDSEGHMELLPVMVEVLDRAATNGTRRRDRVMIEHNLIVRAAGPMASGGPYARCSGHLPRLVQLGDVRR